MAYDASCFVGVDRALGGDDRGDAADRRADREQGGELVPKLEALSQPHHERARDRELERDQNQAQAAELEDVAEHEPHAEQRDADLQEQLVGVDAGREDAEPAKHAEDIAHDEADQRSPKARTRYSATSGGGSCRRP